MSRRSQENLVVGALLLLFTVVLVMSFDYGPRARLVPVPIAIIAILLALGQLVWQNLRPSDELHVDVLELVAGRDGSNRRRAAQEESAAGKPQQHSLAAQIKAFGVVGALLVLFLVLGPMPAIFLFSAGYFILSGEAGWLRGLIYACLCAGFLYLIFGFVLNIELNRGLMAPVIDQYVHF